MHLPRARQENLSRVEEVLDEGIGELGEVLKAGEEIGLAGDGGVLIVNEVHKAVQRHGVVPVVVDTQVG